MAHPSVISVTTSFFLDLSTLTVLSDSFFFLTEVFPFSQYSVKYRTEFVVDLKTADCSITLYAELLLFSR